MYKLHTKYVPFWHFGTNCTLLNRNMNFRYLPIHFKPFVTFFKFITRVTYHLYTNSDKRRKLATKLKRVYNKILQTLFRKKFNLDFLCFHTFFRTIMLTS